LWARAKAPAEIGAVSFSHTQDTPSTPTNVLRCVATLLAWHSLTSSPQWLSIVGDPIAVGRDPIPFIVVTSWVLLVLFAVQNRTFGPHFLATHEKKTQRMPVGNQKSRDSGSPLHLQAGRGLAGRGKRKKQCSPVEIKGVGSRGAVAIRVRRRNPPVVQPASSCQTLQS
jgi:hypothetical protein